MNLQDTKDSAQSSPWIILQPIPVPISAGAVLYLQNNLIIAGGADAKTLLSAHIDPSTSFKNSETKINWQSNPSLYMPFKPWFHIVTDMNAIEFSQSVL